MKKLVSLIAVVLAIAFLSAIIWYVRHRSQHEKRREMSKNNLKAISLAVHEYHSRHFRLPPRAIVDKDGQALLSWRVALLPYLEHAPLYQRFKLDEPWDSPHNRKLITEMPRWYRTPGTGLGEGMTCYQAVVGERTMFPKSLDAKVGFGSVIDGLSHTAMVVEVAPERAVVWTKPADYEFDADNPLAGLGGHWDGDFLVVCGDSSARAVSLEMPPKDVLLFFWRDDQQQFLFP